MPASISNNTAGSSAGKGASANARGLAKQTINKTGGKAGAPRDSQSDLDRLCEDSRLSGKSPLDVKQSLAMPKARPAAAAPASASLRVMTS